MELDDPEDSPQNNGRRTRKPRSNDDDEFAGYGAKESEAEESDAYEDVDPRELETGLPEVKGTKSKYVFSRQSANRLNRKMVIKDGNKSRLGSLTLTFPSPKKPGK